MVQMSAVDRHSSPRIAAILENMWKSPPGPLKRRGTKYLRSPASRSASILSRGNRLRVSTSCADARSTPSATDRAMTSTETSAAAYTGFAMRSAFGEHPDRLFQRPCSAESLLRKQRCGKYDTERSFQVYQQADGRQ